MKENQYSLWYKQYLKYEINDILTTAISHFFFHLQIYYSNFAITTVSYISVYIYHINYKKLSIKKTEKSIDFWYFGFIIYHMT